jgi:hypothetical protein
VLIVLLLLLLLPSASACCLDALPAAACCSCDVAAAVAAAAPLLLLLLLLLLPPPPPPPLVCYMCGKSVSHAEPAQTGQPVHCTPCAICNKHGWLVHHPHHISVLSLLSRLMTDAGALTLGWPGHLVSHLNPSQPPADRRCSLSVATHTDPTSLLLPWCVAPTWQCKVPSPCCKQRNEQASAAVQRHWFSVKNSMMPLD